MPHEPPLASALFAFSASDFAERLVYHSRPACGSARSSHFRVTVDCPLPQRRSSWLISGALSAYDRYIEKASSDPKRITPYGHRSFSVSNDDGLIRGYSRGSACQIGSSQATVFVALRMACNSEHSFRIARPVKMTSTGQSCACSEARALILLVFSTSAATSRSSGIIPGISVKPATRKSPRPLLPRLRRR